MKEIIFTEIPGAGGNIGKIELNRPQALNALTQNMCVELSAQLKKWAVNSKIKAVIIRASGDKAFCAGGDIKKLYTLRNEPIELLSSFFKHEYEMNAVIAHFPKPYISFLNGITMGGGAGISIHGSHRVATPRLIFAMPETAIGFFPDVGAGYFFTRCIGKMGWYLGLTGNSINADDAFALNLVNFLVTPELLDAIEQSIIETEFTATEFDAVTDIINKFSTAAKASTLLTHQQKIEACFSKNTMEEIVEALKNIHEPFFDETVKTLQSRSPLSLKVTLEHLNRCVKYDIDEVLREDYRLGVHFLQSHDFFEGIRAMLIDKDKKPHWKPPSLREIPDATVAEYF